MFGRLARPLLLLLATVVVAASLSSTEAPRVRADEDGSITASVLASSPPPLELKLWALPTRARKGQWVFALVLVRNTSSAPVGPASLQLLHPPGAFSMQVPQNSISLGTIGKGFFSWRIVFVGLRAGVPGNHVVVATAGAPGATLATSNAVVIKVQ